MNRTYVASPHLETWIVGTVQLWFMWVVTVVLVLADARP